MNWTVPWCNEAGQVRWQPQLPSGDRLWIDSRRWWMWEPTSSAPPVLYRSERRAERIARREHKRAQRNSWVRKVPQ